MEIFFVEMTQTAIVFVLMGVLKVVSEIARSEGEVSFNKMFSIFYISTVGGAGFFSLLISHNPWFNNFPQKIFTIMVMTYSSFHLLERLKDSTFITKFIDFIVSLKGK